MAKRMIAAGALGALLFALAGCSGVGDVILGTWAGAFAGEDSAVTFSSDGTFRAEPSGEAGTWESSGSEVVLRPDGGGEEKFSFDVEDGGNTLVLERDGESFTLRKETPGASVLPDSDPGQDAAGQGE